MIKINLLPYRAAVKKENLRQQISIAALTLLLAVILIAWNAYSVSSEAGQLDDNIAETEREIKAQKVSLDKINQFKKKKETVTKKLDVIAQLEKGKTGPVHILDDIATSLPGIIWLESIEDSKRGLELTGISADNETLSRYMLNLEKSDYLKDVDLVKVEKYKAKRKDSSLIGFKKFTITCRIVYPKGA
jgi:type IV pilus assembly protein PilN